MNKRNTLIFLTAGFPFGTGETFIENELPFLSEGFDRIILFTPERYRTAEMRAFKENVIVQTYQETTPFLRRINTLFDRRFWQALRQDLSRKNRSCSALQAFRIAWGVFAKAGLIEKQLEDVFKNYAVSPEETTLYSYWLDESALGIALIKQKKRAFNAVSRAHRWDVYEDMHPIPFLPFRNLLGKSLDGISCIAEDNLRYLQNRFPEIPQAKIGLSYLGTLPLNEREKPAKDAAFLMVSCSSVIKRKRVIAISEALKLSGDGFYWTHLGGGPELSELQTSVESRANIKDTITLRGDLSNAAIRQFYETNQVDLFISLSESEGLPVSMMEAQSAGIPILATDVGGVSEIVKEGETGWLLPADCSPGQVAEKLNKIRQIPTTEMQEMRIRCQEHWEALFSAEKNYRQFVKELGGYCTR
jgi:glycosyltransferase involved in cell wall biosynthesis